MQTEPFWNGIPNWEPATEEFELVQGDWNGESTEGIRNRIGREREYGRIEWWRSENEKRVADNDDDRNTK